MPIKRTVSQGCCGNSGSTILFYLDKPITKNALPTFIDANYIVPSHYATSGIFYVRSPEGLVATGSFGTTKITVKCGNFERDRKLDEFQTLLEQALNA